MAIRSRLTYRDYLDLPEDGRRYEILDGELYVTAAPSLAHQRVARNLTVLLTNHLADRDAGEVLPAPLDVILDAGPSEEGESNIAQPDLVYVEQSRQGQLVGRGVEGPPTLMIEILSPSTERRDRGVKMRVYAQHRVPYYWIVDCQHRAIEVYRLEGEQYAIVARGQGTAPVSLPPFPELSFSPDRVFRGV